MNFPTDHARDYDRLFHDPPPVMVNRFDYKAIKRAIKVGGGILNKNGHETPDSAQQMAEAIVELDCPCQGTSPERHKEHCA